MEHILSDKGEELLFDSLTEQSRKDIITLNAFYFMYGIAKEIDGINNGRDFYESVNVYSLKFQRGGVKVIINYLQKLSKNSDLYKTGRRLLVLGGRRELAAISFDNKNKERLISVFDEELFQL